MVFDYQQLFAGWRNLFLQSDGAKRKTHPRMHFRSGSFWILAGVSVTAINSLLPLPRSGAVALSPSVLPVSMKGAGVVVDVRKNCAIAD